MRRANAPDHNNNGEDETHSHRRCAADGCRREGNYPAPKSRSALRDYLWFCLEHVKLYNKGWDYFKGRTSDEIYKEISDDSRWHRPTWINVKKHGFFDIYDLNGKCENKYNSFNKNSLKNINNDIEHYLKVLDVKLPIKLSDLKKQYKIMVKKFHPDVSENYNEEKIIKLNDAYSELIKYIKQ